MDFLPADPVLVMLDRIFWGYRNWYLRSPRLRRSVGVGLLSGLWLVPLLLLGGPLTRARAIILGVGVLAIMCAVFFDRRGEVETSHDLLGKGWAYRIWEPFSRFPPLLGALLHGLVMAAVTSFMLLEGPLARQVPLFIIMIALFILASYGGRVIRQRTTSLSGQNHDAGDQSSPPGDPPP